MSPIATVRRDRDRPAAATEPVRTRFGTLQGRVMFCIRCANIGRPYWVKIQREPGAPDNVLVRGRSFDAVLEPINRAGEKRGITGIERAIHGGRFPAPVLGGLGKRL